ncbi:hypothetical protein LPJ73_000948 [Coemansia sp. RSA 2703]|nr:hypothetical protein LPJ73_000948 [Coemansia sp. RSA 2703]KAJ2361833.1 hypothetical protein IW150_007147 [Coemansia sp. RSA 2607]KAJ2385482.1 hypothetical protein GGI05_004686 [Coemansia sp. RSA 2603]
MSEQEKAYSRTEKDGSDTVGDSWYDNHDEIPSPATPPHLSGQPYLSDLVRNSSGTTTLDTTHVQAYVAASSRRQYEHDSEVTDDSEEYEEGEEGAGVFDPRFTFDEKGDATAAVAKRAVGIPSQSWWRRVVSDGGWGRTLRFFGLYMALPFVTGVMAGMGEIFANEVMFRWGWRGARPIQVPGRNGRVFPIDKHKSVS